MTTGRRSDSKATRDFWARINREDRAADARGNGRPDDCRFSPSGRHSLYDGAAGGKVCVWCHYGDDDRLYCRNSHCVLLRDHAGDHRDAKGATWTPAR
jgi:hypothetical protein